MKELFEYDLIMTGLCKEDWILATLSKENSNQKKYDLQVAMIPIVSEKKASKYMAVEIEIF